MARLDVNQTIVRQRAEIIAKRETRGELIWDSAGLDEMGLEVHRTVLRRHGEKVERDMSILRMLGWPAPGYAMPGVVIHAGVRTTLSQLRNNDAHLWDDLVSAKEKLAADNPPANP